jgi:hypothetical protein
MDGNSLTLDDAEKERLLINANDSGLVKSADRPPRSGPELNPEIKRITNNVSNFFGNIFKEVKSFSTVTTDELVANMGSPSPTAPIATPAGQCPPGQLYNSQQQREYQRNFTTESEPDNQEEFELQLALALSLSEDTSGPTHPSQPPLLDDLQGGEVPLVRTESPGKRIAIKLAKKAESVASSSK